MWQKLVKQLKLADNYVSMLLGFLVVLVLGVFVFNIFKRGATPPEQPGEITQPAATTEEAAQAKPEKTHTVTVGENLWKIAEKYYQSGYNWVDLAQANNLKNPDHIEVGQVLTIPEVTPILPETGIAGAATPQKKAEIPQTYTVVHGDNLWRIALRFYNNGYKWVEIARANNLANPNLIHAGNVLTLPH